MRWISLLLALLLSAAAPAVAGEGYTVPAVIEVTGENITIGDLVVSGDRELSAKARETVIAESPDPGRSRILTGRYVRAQMTIAGLEGVRTPSHIEIRRTGQVIDPNLGEQEVVNFIRERAIWPADQYRLEVVRRHDPIPVTPGPVTAKLTQYPKEELAGRHSYQVEYRRDGELLGRGNFTVEVSVAATVYVAAHRLSRGVVLAETDLTAKQMPLGEIQGTPITDRAKIIGSRTKHVIQEGQILTTDQLQAAPMIRKGEVVQIRACRGELAVTAYGIARESGAAGEMIKVENLQSKAVVYGRVTDQTTIEVMF